MLVWLFFILTFAGSVFSTRVRDNDEDRCPENEYFTTDDVSCPKTCGNRLLPRGTPDECEPYTGCVCDYGYVRLHDNATGPCIKKSQCSSIPRKCGRNEVPTSCKSICPPDTCESIYTRYSCDPSLQCEPGCDCEDNYLRDSDGDCIPSEYCFSPDGRRKKCGRHAVFKECPNPCPPTCDQPNPEPCTKSCARTGCECAPGYILNKIGGKCIRPEKCPERYCSANERYVVDDVCCVRTCANRDVPEELMGACKPTTGCVCDYGYVRENDDATGPCIPEEQCGYYGSCNGDPNASPTSCASACPSTCAQPDTSYLPCSQVCDSSGCVCNPGYVLTEIGGSCIPLYECPGNYGSCNGDPNASPTSCASSCPATCAQPDTSYLACAQVCDSSGCVCNPGYVLSEIGGLCIPLYECPDDYGSCNGDPNASPTLCASACPATCAQPDTSYLPCAQACNPSGCECNPGYVLSEIGGSCIPLYECPDDYGSCNGDPNASPTSCASACPATCTQPDTSYLPCAQVCDPSGCECNPGYVLSEIGGSCIPLYECPDDYGSCNGDPNASPTSCASACPATCAQPDTSYLACAQVCDSSGCECDPGYVLSEIGGSCIPLYECPGNYGSCNGDPNASPTSCASSCPATCAEPDTSYLVCAQVCDSSGCECDTGYVLSETGGICIPLYECPGYGNCNGDESAIQISACELLCASDTDETYITIPNDSSDGCGGDPNASFNDCPSACPATCDQPDTSDIYCSSVCNPPGCECNPGFVLDEFSGRCILPQQCPTLLDCGTNEIASDCAIICPPQSCESIYTQYLCAQSECTPGCNCIDGFLRDSSGICIPSEKCPLEYEGCNGDPNASFNDCPSACPATCDQPDTSDIYCIAVCDPPGCECNPGFVLDEFSGRCILPEECPNRHRGGRGRGSFYDEGPACPENTTYVNCFVGCPTNYCRQDDSNYIVACDPPYPCPPGCACIEGYLMLSSDDPRCILASDCPPVECTRPNEIYDSTPCNDGCDDFDTDCDDSYSGRPRCVCVPGYRRNQDGICVPASQCYGGCNGDPNAVPDDCPSSCPTTCDTLDNSARSSHSSGVMCIDACDPSGCVCKQGYILSKKGGKCIKPEECPNNQCKGDRNATLEECPNPCPPTCADPDIAGKECPAICLEDDCECKQGYILDEEDGECISPSDCPGGSPACGKNKTYVDCFVGCPPSYCPVDDSRAIIACSVAYPCPPGCACLDGYLMLSYEDPKCILASECPPVNCTRPNEVWYPHASNCRSDDCDNTNVDCDDSSGGMPRCVCEPEYYRNSSGVCVPAAECDTGCNGDPNAMPDDCPSYCPPTCEQPDTSGVICIDACHPSRCACKPSFILTEIGGKCVRPDECPDNQQCNGDRNATTQECPSACQPTCSSPESDEPCITVCDPSGCACKQGYLRSEKDGPCILPEDCPGGIPSCGTNRTYVYCKTACQMNYCPDSDTYAIRDCALPDPCPPGCICANNYLMLSYEDSRCILASDCPPFNCTRPNEVYERYPSNCYLDECENMYVDCGDSSTGPPRCVCKPGYYRNRDRACVPASECDTGCNGDLNATAHDCPSSCPPTCEQPDTSNVACNKMCDPNRCVCKPGFILTEKGGKCVKPSDCPHNQQCNGDHNAMIHECPSPCQATCSAPDTDRPCMAMCLEVGCICKPGYIRLESNGSCVSPGDCPGGGPSCGVNKTYVSCKAPCPTDYCPESDTNAMPACARPEPCSPGCICDYGYLILSYEDQRCVMPSDCPPVNCTRPNEVFDYYPSNCYLDDCENMYAECGDSSSGRPRCVCKPGYYRNRDGICVPASECDTGCNGDFNATSHDCPSSCPPTCEQPDTSGQACIAMCDPSRCVCKPGFILTKKGGQCVKPSDCPNKEQCNGDQNATIVECRSACEPSCASPDTDVPCIAVCRGIGCTCKPGYLRLEPDGPCVKPEDCPGGVPTCGANKTYVPCTFGCPTNYCPQDDSRFMVTCSMPYPCPAGCACNQSYLKVNYEDRRCVKYSDCPSVNCTRPNEVWNPTPSNCFLERCKEMDNVCDESYSSPPRCVCKEGYCRNSDDICIPASEYEKPLNCGVNEIEMKCRTICPPQNCEIAYTSYACEEYQGICERGCDCLPNYLRNGSGICIPNDECPYPSSPICGVNEIARDCRRICPPQTCESRYALYKCSGDIPCEPGCDCVPNYLRNSKGVCIPAEKCDSPQTCGVPDKCIRTCAAPNPPNCPYDPPETNIDGCECMEGYILSEVGGKCIRIEDCPRNVSCNGDPHARPKRCPLPCPARCDSPDATPCKKMCEPIACECESGYMIDDESGKCVLPDECPGGNPCGENEEFRDCKYSCPMFYNYCPVDDSRPKYVCDDPGHMCLPGCACKLNYKRLSYEDDRCIVACDCPPVKCTRPNEVWDGCPPECFSGYCEDREYQDVPCNSLVLNCQPQCICERDTFRNASDICVPASECPPDCEVPDMCKRTCASPNPTNCPYEPSESNVDGCECMEGYILSEIGGKCIKIEECPKDIACNGDPNAQPRQCPAPCPSTCESPDEVICYKMCEPIGCECKPGYLLSNATGQCILPDQCPGGDPCGPNAHFVPCKIDCPSDYCPEDDSRDTVICDPSTDCLSGCVCDLNHKRLSREVKRCIVSSDCPPVNCTRPNEVWDGCPSECFSGYCEDRDQQDTICYTLVLNCRPQCVCKRDTFRNASDICVPACECPPLPPVCDVPDNCIRTCALPNPPDCPYEPSESNMDGCECMDGYILAEIGGKCIPIEECPKDIPCDGDPNAEPKQCPAPCPSTCDSPNAIPCRRRCDPIACACKPGYMLNSTGQCILPDECPGGNPCGRNEIFVPCKFECPTDYCPEDDSRDIVICDPGPNCLSGCICKLNHKRLSRKKRQCIVSSSCPPVTCTRRNEKWSKCPSECLAERCEDIDNQPTECNTLVQNCQPRCICQENYFRNASDICVCPDEC